MLTRLELVSLIALFAFFAATLCVARLYSIMPTSAKSSVNQTARTTASLAVFLGSGGHTTEALALLQTLDLDKYTPRTYIISEGDSLSADKARKFETSRDPSSTSYTVITLPRARRVHQSLVSTPATALRSLVGLLGIHRLSTISCRKPKYVLIC
ncbi:UDP-N-acetylglucosamine transferase subunit ALG14 [Flagelloscypha sp. PMI_526]|nr:UDP-N-acetylglucosamine transferase subunit ALG14 [Flagelloscypha sp. PMI_526]